MPTSTDKPFIFTLNYTIFWVEFQLRPFLRRLLPHGQVIEETEWYV